MPSEHLTNSDISFEALSTKMKPGINYLRNNPALEVDFLKYRAAGLDAEFAGNSGYYKIDQLSETRRGQISKIVDEISEFAPPELVRERVNAIRVHFVDSHMHWGEDVGGNFSRGLATVVKSTDPEIEDFRLLHEISHGLSLTGPIFAHESSIVAAQLTLPNPSEKATAGLNISLEAIMDRLALYAGSKQFHDDVYLAEQAGGFPKAYRILERLTKEYPELVHDMYNCLYVSGTFSDMDRAKFFGETFSAAAESQLPPNDDLIKQASSIAIKELRE